MIASPKCIDMIKQFEGFSAKPYLCPAHVWTIGYGSTRYENGMPVNPSDIAIDEARAISIMKATLKTYEAAINRYVIVTISQNQFDALVDFAYNMGAKALLNSTLLKRVNERKFLAAYREFAKWVHADGKVLQGLVKRRAAEALLFGSM